VLLGRPSLLHPSCRESAAWVFRNICTRLIHFSSRASGLGAQKMDFVVADLTSLQLCFYWQYTFTGQSSLQRLLQL
jgi:hypothetical protein